MTKISAVIIAHNEESVLEDCLNSVKWADEIVVVDDSSIDNTAKIAEKFTTKVYQHKSVGYVEPVRSFAIAKTTGDWILLLDADERISGTLAQSLKNVIEGTSASAIAIPRKNYIFGKWLQHTGWWPDYNIRLFKKDAVVWSEKIHSQPKVNGEILHLDASQEMAITHQNYTSVAQYLEKMMRYTDVEAKEFHESAKRVSVDSFITLPAQEFLSRFFAGKGYKDGVHGLVLSLLQAVSVFVVALKVWEMQGFEPREEKDILKKLHTQSRKIYKEFIYWIANELLTDERNALKKAKLKILRKRNKR